MKSFKYLLLPVFFFNISLIAQESDEDTANDIEEVVVTATSRETSIFEVPYNISAVSGSDIDSKGIQDTAELLRSFAGISTIDRGSRNAGTVNNIRIRGLNVDSNALQDYPVSAAAAVSTYVDKTPVFANFLLKDLNRVEVLRGPQSTLYGSGALGGTVRYIKNKPSLDGFSSRVNLTASQVKGSDDIGDVSWKVPTVVLRFPSNIPDVTFHHWSASIAAATPIAHKGATAGAKVVAMTALDFLTKPDKLIEAKNYFNNIQSKEDTYRPMISETDPPPVYLNTEIMEKYRDEMKKFYFDETKYDTYLEQLGVEYPTIKED